MALRILTGIISPRVSEGRVTIHFNPHEVEGRDAHAVELETTGASGEFVSRPGKVLSIREFKVDNWGAFLAGPALDSDWFRIRDHAWTKHLLEVSWSFELGTKIQEISYMIVGEVAEVDPRELAAEEVWLADEGAALVAIKVLDEATHQKAAEELVDYLNKLVETAPFSITTEDPDGSAIYLGDPTLIGITSSDLGPDDFVVAAKPNLYGANDLVIAGGSELAAYYSVTAVLESLGCHWYFPGELGEVLPEPSTSLVLRPPLPRSGLIHRPDFRIRGVRGEKAGDVHLRDWGRRNFQNVERRAYNPEHPPEDPLFTPERIQGELGINRRAHTWNRSVPLKYRDRDHPDFQEEIFALDEDGNRVVPWETENSNNVNLCPGSALTADVLTEGIWDLLCHVPGLKHVVLWPEDVGFKCTCEYCNALDETDADPNYQLNSKRVLTLTNRVAERIAETHPEVMLITPAYATFLAPPVDESLVPAPNVRMVYARQAEHNHALDDPFSTLNWELYYHYYRQWLERLNGEPERMLLYEYYNKNSWLGLPWPIIHILKRDICRFNDDRLLGLWSQYKENIAPNGLVYYIAAHLLWDTEVDVDELMEQYSTYLFGPEAGAHILAYYQELEDAAQASDLEFVSTKDGSPEWEIIRLFTPELLTRLNDLLTDAGDVVGLTTKQQERIEGMKTGLRYARLMLCWIHGAWFHKYWRSDEEGNWPDKSITAFWEFLDDLEDPPESYQGLLDEIERLLDDGPPWLKRQKYIDGENGILEWRGNPKLAEGITDHRDYWVTNKPEWRAVSPADRPILDIPEGSNLALWVYGLDFDWEALHNRGEHLLRIYNAGEDPELVAWREILPPWARRVKSEYDRKARVIILDNISSDEIGCTGPWTIEVINQPNEVGSTEEGIAGTKKSSKILGIWLLPEESDFTMPSETEDADRETKISTVCTWTGRIETDLDSIRQSSIAFVEFPYDGKICSDADSPFGRQDVEATISR